MLITLDEVRERIVLSRRSGTVLDLSRLEINDAELKEILELTEVVPQIEYVNLSHNAFANMGAQLLAETNNILYLDISGNKIDDKGGYPFSQNTHILGLNITGTYIFPKVAKYIHERLVQNLKDSSDHLLNLKITINEALPPLCTESYVNNLTDIMLNYIQKTPALSLIQQLHQVQDALNVVDQTPRLEVLFVESEHYKALTNKIFREEISRLNKTLFKSWVFLFIAFVLYFYNNTPRLAGVSGTIGIIIALKAFNDLRTRGMPGALADNVIRQDLDRGTSLSEDVPFEPIVSSRPPMLTQYQNMTRDEHQNSSSIVEEEPVGEFVENKENEAQSTKQYGLINRKNRSR